MMRVDMRDDVLGLAAMKMGGPRPMPTSPTLSRTSSSGKQTFASALTRAAARPFAAAPQAAPALPPRTLPPGTLSTFSKPPLLNAPKPTPARLPTPASKPYVSPLTGPPPANPLSAPPRRAAVASPSRPTSLTPPSLSRTPTTVDRPRPSVEAVPPANATVAPDANLAAGAMALGSYPHPDQDNGRGMHWIPTTRQSTADVDRFVARAQSMGVKWVTFLNKGANIGDNDYLVTKLAGAGIEPVMRLYTDTLAPIQGDVEGMVRHFTALGVHYFQPFNEPNLKDESPDGQVSVDRYLDAWIPAARAIVRGGGLPGFGAMAPGGDVDDQQFLASALDALKARGEVHLLDKAWLSMHNYTWNHPIEDRGDGDGFFKFRAYHAAVQAALGRDIPIIGTEGGTFTGEQEDSRMAPVTPGMAADWTQQAFTYMRDNREPYMFASSVWTIADMAAGGSDRRFEAQAMFKADGTQSATVAAIQAVG
jgi:hypothetical protein